MIKIYKDVNLIFLLYMRLFPFMFYEKGLEWRLWIDKNVSSKLIVKSFNILFMYKSFYFGGLWGMCVCFKSLALVLYVYRSDVFLFMIMTS